MNRQVHKTRQDAPSKDTKVSAEDTLQAETPALDTLMRDFAQADTPLDSNALAPRTVLQMQRDLGNQAVLQMVGRGSPSTTKALNKWFYQDHPATKSLHQPDVRFRLPEFARIKAAFEDPDLKIPEAVIKDRVAKLLSRMQADKRLKTTDDVPTIIAKVFPSPGVIDETAFNAAVDTSDKEVIYKDIMDAFTKVKTPDKAKLKKAIDDSIALISVVEGNSAGLKEVFGSKDADAKTIYGKARQALKDTKANMDTAISTDYNLDDPEVGLGGWASHGARHMHLVLDVVKVTDDKDAQITLIHEAAHLAHPNVDDKGYYPPSTPPDVFLAADEATKISNAAHFEELPRRELGTAQFAGKTFTPGVSASGGAVTREDTVRGTVTEHFRKAWDAAVDTHTFMRGVRISYLNGSKKPFIDNKTIIMEISKLEDLTIHTQAPGQEIVTTLDITLTESIARSMGILGSMAKSTPFPIPGALTDTELRDQMIDATISKFDNLLKDATRDRALVDWMVAHYRSLPSV